MKKAINSKAFQEFKVLMNAEYYVFKNQTANFTFGEETIGEKPVC